MTGALLPGVGSRVLLTKNQSTTFYGQVFRSMEFNLTAACCRLCFLYDSSIFFVVKWSNGQMGGTVCGFVVRKMRGSAAVLLVGESTIQFSAPVRQCAL